MWALRPRSREALAGWDEVAETAEDQEVVVTGQNDVRVEAEVVLRFERAGRRNDRCPGRMAEAPVRDSVDHGWNVKRLVELRGLEPLTPCMPCSVEAVLGVPLDVRRCSSVTVHSM